MALTARAYWSLARGVHIPNHPPTLRNLGNQTISALSVQFGFISCRSEVVFTFILWEVTEEFSDADPEGFDGSFGSLSQERLQFRKGHLDRVQVRRVAREETQLCALGLDRFPDFRALMRGEIVDQDDVSFRERWSKHFCDISEETFAIDRAVEDE